MKMTRNTLIVILVLSFTNKILRYIHNNEPTDHLVLVLVGRTVNRKYLIIVIPGAQHEQELINTFQNSISKQKAK